MGGRKYKFFPKLCFFCLKAHIFPPAPATVSCSPGSERFALLFKKTSAGHPGPSNPSHVSCSLN